jgi:hypothetical protein
LLNHVGYTPAWFFAYKNKLVIRFRINNVLIKQCATYKKIKISIVIDKGEWRNEK